MIFVVKKISFSLKSFLAESIAQVRNHRVDYIKYWNERYKLGGNSGDGSYGLLAEFKASIINQFIQDKDIRNVIEFGCGDGNNLKMMKYNSYLGLDIAESAVEICSKAFSEDRSKSFMLYNPLHFYNKGFLKADVVICLDVLYHIIPEEDYLKTLKDIFSCSRKFIILYTRIDFKKSDLLESSPHIKHRNVLDYIEKYFELSVEKIIPPKYPEKSLASFIFLKKQNNMN